MHLISVHCTKTTDEQLEQFKASITASKMAKMVADESNIPAKKLSNLVAHLVFSCANLKIKD